MRFLLLVTFLGCASAANAIVLWRLDSNISPSMVPPFVGQPSPFPQPKAQMVATQPDDDTSRAAAARQRALANAKKMAAPATALQLSAAQLQVRGVTNGAQGVRLLVGENWVGLNETMQVRYAINGATSAALQELQSFDAAAAYQLQTKLNAQRVALEEQGVKVLAVDLKARQITLQTPQGKRQFPLLLEP